MGGGGGGGGGGLDCLEDFELGRGAHPPSEAREGIFGEVLAAAHGRPDAVIAEHDCCVALRIPPIRQPVGLGTFPLAV